MMMNGNSVGSMIWNQRRRPSLAPLNTAFGEISMTAKSTTTPIPGRLRFMKGLP